MHRRELLSMLGVAMTPGCVAGVDTTPTLTRESPTDSSAGPIGTDEVATSCASDKVPLSVAEGEIDSSIGGLSISVSPEAAHAGEELTISLRNTTDERLYTGNRSTYDIHRRVSQQWRSIFWVDPDDPQAIFQMDSVPHEPGEGFTWRLKLTRDDLTHEIKNGGGKLHVCSPIGPGLYRFVFFGHSEDTAGGPGTEANLGAQFTVLAD